MNEDYTPGHALTDMAGAVDMDDLGNVEFLTPILTRLYKAGQANERAAIIAGVRGYGTNLPDSTVEFLNHLADLIERGELS